MIRLSKKGITFDYNNDEITWFWWWAREFAAFSSFIYNLNFNRFNEYWQHVGRATNHLPVSKIQGFDIEDLIAAWVKLKYRTGNYVILYNINVEAKPATFWRSIPDRLKTELLSDIVILNGNSGKSAGDLVGAIPKSFATAVMVCDGQIYWTLDQPEV